MPLPLLTKSLGLILRKWFFFVYFFIPPPFFFPNSSTVALLSLLWCLRILNVAGFFSFSNIVSLCGDIFPLIHFGDSRRDMVIAIFWFDYCRLCFRVFYSLIHHAYLIRESFILFIFLPDFISYFSISLFHWSNITWISSFKLSI